jgi:hypothetical protein
MEEHQQKKVFVPPKRRLFLSLLTHELPEVAIALIAVMVIVRAEMTQVIIYFLVFCMLAMWRFRNQSRKQVEHSEIIIADRNIYGFPDVPWFNGFRTLEKVSIPFDKIDRNKTGTLKTRRWWSGNFIWSTNGKNILLSNDFDEEQLREIAGLIGCPVE